MHANGERDSNDGKLEKYRVIQAARARNAKLIRAGPSAIRAILLASAYYSIGLSDIFSRSFDGRSRRLFYIVGTVSVMDWAV